MFIENLFHEIRATPAGVESFLASSYFYKHLTSLRSKTFNHQYKPINVLVIESLRKY
jgi:hypothetical protein